MRWVLLVLLTLGLTVAGLPATSASAASDGVVKGTVTYHQAGADRTLQVFVGDGNGTWAADPSRTTKVASNGSYTAQVPAGVPVKLRVSFGDPTYSYFFGDAFSPEFAQSVTAASGATVSGVNLQVPFPVSYSGRLVDRGGNPVAGTVTPTANTDGGSGSLVPEPIVVDASGEYQVFLPARSGGVYEGGVMGATQDGEIWAWLGGGDGYEPDYYLNPTPGDSFTGKDIKLAVGTPSVSPSTSAKPKTLRATRTPVVRGVVRKGHRLYSTKGAYSARPTVVRFQWLRNGHAIGGATRASYKLRKADVRKHISVRVTAIRSGAKVRATSARTAAVKAR